MGNMPSTPARRMTLSRQAAAAASVGAFPAAWTRPLSMMKRSSRPRLYHTIKEAKNGEGPAPIKTPKGWLHMAHGVRNTAAGLRYVLYLYLSDLQEPWKVTHRPGGYFLAPTGIERVGDVSNVAFCNGWVCRADGAVYIYYASSDTRIHVATSSVDRLLDYVLTLPRTACARRRASPNGSSSSGATFQEPNRS